MIKNYFKIAWRNLWRNKIFSVIKILGLSIGLTVCMLIFLYTKDEISYDRFHKNKGQLHRIIQTLQMGQNPPQTIGITNGVIGEAFAKEIPEIQQYVRINGEPVTVKKNNNDVVTEQSMFVDDNFFTVFTFQLLEGNKRTALKDMHSVVLSKEMAKKYFGTEDVIGETMLIKRNDEFENYTVTAIAENFPQNSTIKVDMFLPIKYGLTNRGNDWFGGSLNTFLLLSPQANVQTVESKMQALFDKIAVPIGYYFINKWLQDFAYRISIGWWMFALAGALVIIIAILTMSFKAIKAAIANPVKSLRTE